MERKGSVLGIDVGWSIKRPTSAACRLEWDDTTVRWTARRFRAVDSERRAVIADVIGGRPVAVAAFDGPLCPGFNVIARYRMAERMLTRRLQEIGKPAQSSTPNGKRLNAEANVCVRTVLNLAAIAPARHSVRIDRKAVVEAFPSSFLGLMIADPTKLRIKRKNRSDVFFETLADNGDLKRLITYLLPKREIQLVASVKNHDERAALVCALTALAVAANKYSAVGNADGWIILPPRRFICDQAWSLLTQNADDEENNALQMVQ